MKRVTLLPDQDGRIVVEGLTMGEAAKMLADYFGTDMVSMNCGRPIKTEPLPKSETKPTFDYTRMARVHSIYYGSMVDGPGKRNVIKFQGCSIQCPGCYSHDTWSKIGGSTLGVVAIVDMLLKEPCDGVTILGGEPFDQPHALNRIVEMLKERDVHVCVYTGYTFEELAQSASFRDILSQIDLLIDGPFIAGKTLGAGEYRGSSNQRMIESKEIIKKLTAWITRA